MSAKSKMKEMFDKTTQPSTLKAVATLIVTVAASTATTIFTIKKLEERKNS